MNGILNEEATHVMEKDKSQTRSEMELRYKVWKQKLTSKDQGISKNSQTIDKSSLIVDIIRKQQQIESISKPRLRLIIQINNRSAYCLKQSDQITNYQEDKMFGKSYHFKIGDIVWAKVRGYSWWPAKIGEINCKPQVEKKYTCYFINDKSHCIVPEKGLLNFVENFKINSELAKRKQNLIQSIRKALDLVERLKPGIKKELLEQLTDESRQMMLKVVDSDSEDEKEALIKKRIRSSNKDNTKRSQSSDSSESNRSRTNSEINEDKQRNKSKGANNEEEKEMIKHKQHVIRQLGGRASSPQIRVKRKYVRKSQIQNNTSTNILKKKTLRVITHNGSERKRGRPKSKTLKAKKLSKLYEKMALTISKCMKESMKTISGQAIDSSEDECRDDMDDDDSEDSHDGDNNQLHRAKRSPRKPKDKELLQDEEYKKLVAQYPKKRGRKPKEFYVKLERIQLTLSQRKSQQSQVQQQQNSEQKLKEKVETPKIDSGKKMSENIELIQPRRLNLEDKFIRKISEEMKVDQTREVGIQTLQVQSDDEDDEKEASASNKSDKEQSQRIQNMEQQYIKPQGLTQVQQEAENQCLKLGEALKKAVEVYLDDGNSQTLQKALTNNNELLGELFRSQNVAVESLLNTRVCRSLTFVRQFCQTYCDLNQDQNKLSEEQQTLKAMIEKYKTSLTSVLSKWKNFIDRVFFDEKNQDAQKVLTKQLKKLSNSKRNKKKVNTAQKQQEESPSVLQLRRSDLLTQALNQIEQKKDAKSVNSNEEASVRSNMVEQSSPFTSATTIRKSESEIIIPRKVIPINQGGVINFEMIKTSKSAGKSEIESKASKDHLSKVENAQKQEINLKLPIENLLLSGELKKLYDKNVKYCLELQKNQQKSLQPSSYQ